MREAGDRQLATGPEPAVRAGRGAVRAGCPGDGRRRHSARAALRHSDDGGKIKRSQPAHTQSHQFTFERFFLATVLCNLQLEQLAIENFPNIKLSAAIHSPAQRCWSLASSRCKTSSTIWDPQSWCRAQPRSPATTSGSAALGCRSKGWYVTYDNNVSILCFSWLCVRSFAKRTDARSMNWLTVFHRPSCVARPRWLVH